MASEFMFVFMTMLFFMQGSTLYSSLILIPISGFAAMHIQLNLYMSGLMLFIVVMVFIGGLIILLVSVASILAQEQGNLVTSKILLVLFSSSLIASYTLNKSSSTLTHSSNMASIMAWPQEDLSLLTFISLELLLGLMLITIFVSSFKGLMRGV